MTVRDCKEHGHNFKPRYDFVAPKWLQEESRRDWLVDAGVPIEHIHEKLYVCDVCSKCGASVRRDGTRQEAA